MIVAAKDDTEARLLARDYADDALSDASPDVDVSYNREVTSDKDLTYTGWDRHAIPYGSSDDKTVGEFLDDAGEEASEKASADRQMPLLPGDKKP